MKSLINSGNLDELRELFEKQTAALCFENENEDQQYTKRSTISYSNIEDLDVDLINSNNNEREKLE